MKNEKFLGINGNYYINTYEKYKFNKINFTKGKILKLRFFIINNVFI